MRFIKLLLYFVTLVSNLRCLKSLGFCVNKPQTETDFWTWIFQPSPPLPSQSTFALLKWFDYDQRISTESSLQSGNVDLLTCCDFTPSDFLESQEEAFDVAPSLKPWACLFCGKRFSCSSNLKTHSRVHTGEQPYACSMCEKRFSKQCNLVRHERTHTGLKPYTCVVCALHFFDKSVLNVHERTHTGLKPFACSRCDQRFTRL